MISTIIGLLFAILDIAFFAVTGISDPNGTSSSFFLRFFNNQIAVHFTASCATIAGELFFRKKWYLGFARLLKISILPVMLAGIGGYSIALALLLFIYGFLYGQKVFEHLLITAFAGISISAGFSTVFHILYLRIDFLTRSSSIRLSDSAVKRETDYDETVTEDNDFRLSRKTPYKGIFVKESGIYQYISHKDITYLSAHGKRTVIHTREKEYVTHRLLNYFVKILPPESFLRLHKSYIVQLSAVSTLQYVKGGKYQVSIKDDEDSHISVGRKYLPELRKALGID